MEGVRCCHPDCALHDFLPFHCPKCEQSYCVEHRSRFVHPCLPETDHNLASESQPGGGSSMLSQTYRSMLNRVQNRHEDLNNTSHRPRTHHQIRRDLQNIPIQTKNFQLFYSRLKTLSDSQSENGGQDAHRAQGSGWSTERQRLQEKERHKQQRIAKKTKCMMIKQKANGNEHIPPELRQYFVIHFDPIPNDGRHSHHGNSDEKLLFLFFNQSQELGEMLQYLKSHYPRNIMLDNDIQKLEQKTFNPAELSVVVKTADSPDWRMWNRNAPIQDMFERYEDIWISYLPTTMVIEAQERINNLLVEQRRILEQLTDSKTTIVPSVATSAIVEGDTSANNTNISAATHSYSKGEQAWYYKAPYVEDEEPLKLNSMEEANDHKIPLMLVQIIGVHHDDFPNIYYTIGMVQPPHGVGLDSQKLVFHTEKQTDKSHLIPFVPTTEPDVHMAAHNTQTHHRSDQQLLHLQAHIESLGHIITIRAIHGKKEFADIRISLLSTVAQIKNLLSLHSNVPVNRMKLIYKGGILKPDNAVVNDLKIPQNARITIMG